MREALTWHTTHCQVKTIEAPLLSGIPRPDRATQKKFGSCGRSLLNSGDGPVLDPGNRSGWKWGSFLSVRLFCYGPGLNFDTTVHNSEIYIWLPKPCPLMWHLVHRNHVRNGWERWPETCKICLPKVALLKFLWTMCSTTQIMECMVTWMTSTAFRCSRNHPSESVGVAMPIGIFKSATFGERVWSVSGYLSRPFLTRFPRTKCYMKG